MAGLFIDRVASVALGGRRIDGRHARAVGFHVRAKARRVNRVLQAPDMAKAVSVGADTAC